MTRTVVNRPQHDLTCLDLSVSSSSWGLGRAAVCDCGTPWTFLLPFSGADVVSRFSRCQPHPAYTAIPPPPLSFQAAILKSGTEQFLAILNLYITLILPVMFRLNQTYGSEEMSSEGFQYGRLVAILEFEAERNDFNNPDSVFCSDASRQVSVLADLWFGGDVVWKVSIWPSSSHIGYQNGTILAILNLCAPMSLTKFGRSLT